MTTRGKIIKENIQDRIVNPEDKQVYISQIDDHYVAYTLDLEYVQHFKYGEATFGGNKAIYTPRPKLIRLKTKEDWLYQTQKSVEEIYVYLVFDESTIRHCCSPEALYWCEAVYVDVRWKQEVCESEDFENITEPIWEGINNCLADYSNLRSDWVLNANLDLTHLVKWDIDEDYTKEEALEDVYDYLRGNPIYFYE